MPSVDVAAPLRAVYDRWTAYEELPSFIAALAAVRRTGIDRLAVRLSGGDGDEHPAELIEQHLDERVAWRSLAGPHHAATITLRPLDGLVQVDLELEGLGDAREVLERFKALAESGNAPAGSRADILHPGMYRGLGEDASTIGG